MKTKKVLLIGWDAADWKVIHPLLDRGKMPNLAHLICNGVMGNLASLRPELSPMLWTSIATGKRPYKHGILGFTEPRPDGKGVRPVTSLSRKTKTIWNILNQNDKQCHVVGWWPSHPAEPIRGAMVSNHFQRATVPYGKPWTVPENTIHPKRLVKNLSELRVHPQELDTGLIQLFIPELSNIDQEKDRRVETVAKIIADTLTLNRATTALMHHEKWDLTAVYFDAIDHFCHGFMNFHPPRLSWVREKEYQLYKEVVTSGYIFHDGLLGSLLAETDEETTVIVVSDHGFHSDHLRPRNIPREPAGPAAQHRPYGVVVISGPDTRSDELLFGSSLLDICPTILSFFGLPVGNDMDGKVLVNSFQKDPGPAYILSWDQVPGHDGSHPETLFTCPVESSEEINRLVELGYIEAPDADQKVAAEKARREIEYNLAKSYMDGGLHAEAELLLVKLMAAWPEEIRFGVELSHCYQSLGQPSKAREMLGAILTSVAKGEEEFYNQYGIAYLLGVAYQAEGDSIKALEYFESAEKTGVCSAALHVQKGNVYEGLKQRVKAQRSYEKALLIDSENSDAMLGLCRIKLSTRQNREAAHQALDIIALKYHTPMAHFHFGVALHRLGRLKDAIRALELSLEQNPNNPAACHRLAHIYGNRLHMEERAVFYKALAKEAGKRIRKLKKGLYQSDDHSHVTLFSPPEQTVVSDSSIPIQAFDKKDLPQTIVVVSGLPRSGTSMLMQMLYAGGLPIVTDNVRVADRDNPRGYFETEKVKRLSGENEWLLEHGGEGVKVIAQLLPFLLESETLSYRVIFIERDLDEVLASQAKMLKNRGKTQKLSSEKILRNAFHRQIEKSKLFLSLQNIPVLYIAHGRCLADPSSVASEINEFLGGVLNISDMIEVVDQSLYHHRKGIVS
jgi:predicted AlkP superfamily phosphohydrolase/phosphomutase/tetratricopeptide (TPR) repeat protein